MMLSHRKARQRQTPRRNKKTNKHESSEIELSLQEKYRGKPGTEKNIYFIELFNLSIFNESRENLGHVNGVEIDCWNLGQLRARGHLFLTWFRTLKGWMWTISMCDARAKYVVKKHGFITFKSMQILNGFVMKNKDTHHFFTRFYRSYPYYYNMSNIHDGEPEKWLNIRCIQTFILVVKKLRRIMYLFWLKN